MPVSRLSSFTKIPKNFLLANFHRVYDSLPFTHKNHQPAAIGVPLVDAVMDKDLTRSGLYFHYFAEHCLSLDDLKKHRAT